MPRADFDRLVEIAPDKGAIKRWLKIPVDREARLVMMGVRPRFVASLGLKNVPAAVLEMRRAIEELGAIGIQLFTNVGGRPRRLSR